MTTAATMSRRKLWSNAATAVLVLALVVPCTVGRPSVETENFDADESSTELVSLSKSTESAIRYNSLNISIVIDSKVGVGNKTSYSKQDGAKHNTDENHNYTSVTHRQIKSIWQPKVTEQQIINKLERADLSQKSPMHEEERFEESISNERGEYGKPFVRKILTKWTDRASFQGLDIHTISGEDYSTEISLGTSTDNNNELGWSSQMETKLVRPKPQHSEETHVLSSNIHVIDVLNSMRPVQYNKPSLNPVVTNYATPKPWISRPYHTIVTKEPTLIKPPKINRPASMHTIIGDERYTSPLPVPDYQFRPDLFEVTTSNPVTSYTDKIVIRPEEYSASSDDCPTVYLTLNNTFQDVPAMGKEACPDLNINVNTNVVNKHVVVPESEEEEPDYASSPFGIPLEDDSESSENNGDYDQSNDSQNADYGNVEAFNDGAVEEGDESESVDSGSTMEGYQSLTRPKKKRRRKNKHEYDYGLGSLNEWVRPMTSMMSWVAALNPFNFGFFSLLITPLAIMLAGTSGVAALFAPWALPYARQSPKVVHVYRPQWHWDHEDNTWSYSSPNNRRRYHRDPRLDEAATQKIYTTKMSLTDKVKSWLLKKFVSFVRSTKRNLKKEERERRKNKK